MVTRVTTGVAPPPAWATVRDTFDSPFRSMWVALLVRELRPVRSRVSPELTSAVTLLTSANVTVPASILVGSSTIAKSLVSARLSAVSSFWYCSTLRSAVPPDTVTVPAFSRIGSTKSVNAFSISPAVSVMSYPPTIVTGGVAPFRAFTSAILKVRVLLSLDSTETAPAMAPKEDPSSAIASCILAAVSTIR